MEKKVNDFILESKGLCFLCSHRDPNSPSVSIHSFQQLSHYLRIDIGKVFSGDGPIPPHLLAKVQNSKLKVELCEECAAVNTHFSVLYQKLEKISMEVENLLRDIIQKLDNVDEENNETEDSEGCGMMIGKDKLLLKQKEEVVKTMREETKQKCCKKLKTLLAPCIHVQNFSQDEITREIEKHTRGSMKDKLSSANTNSDQNIVIESEPVIMALLKTESEDLTTVPNFSENDANSELDDHSNSSQEEDDEEVEIYQSSRSQSKQTNGNGEPVDWKKKYSLDAKTDKHTCKDCPMKFVSFPAFYHHYNRQHLNISYKCSVCKKSFTRVSSLNFHQKNAHKGLKFKCEACSQLFSLESHLSKHRKDNICKPKEMFERGQSTLVILRPSKSPKDFQKLLEISWDPQSGKHICRICSKLFEQKATLQTHYRNYHGKIQYKCSLCQRIFPLRKSYNQHHNLVHLGVRFKCSKCHKLFTEKVSLARHQQSDRACNLLDNSFEAKGVFTI